MMFRLFTLAFALTLSFSPAMAEQSGPVGLTPTSDDAEAHGSAAGLLALRGPRISNPGLLGRHPCAHRQFAGRARTWA